MRITQGTVVIMDFPFSNHDASKIRPALVVSNHQFNNGINLICVPISSKHTFEGFGIELHPTDMDIGKLFSTSFIKYSNIMTAEKKLIKQIAGIIKKEKLQEVLQKIHQIFE